VVLPVLRLPIGSTDEEKVKASSQQLYAMILLEGADSNERFQPLKNKLRNDFLAGADKDAYPNTLDEMTT